MLPQKNRLDKFNPILHFFCSINKLYSQMNQSKKDTAAALIHAPTCVKQNIIDFSSSYNARQVDNYFSLVQQSETQNICLICLEANTPEQLLKMRTCKDVYCKECLYNYLVYKITVGDDIICPAASCSQVLSASDPWFEQLPKWCKDRYQKIRLQNQNLGNTGKKLCQKYECKGTINFDQKDPTCDVCKSLFCGKCKLKQHEGTCSESFGKNFPQWRRCPSCKIFNQKRDKGNKMTCSCGTAFCAMCEAGWSDAHLNCQMEVDPMLENVYNKKSIMDCCKCWNVFKAFFMILLIPFILVIALLAIIITFFFCVIGGFLFSPCYSRAQGYTTVATIFLCPCIGIYSVGYALSNVFCEMITTSCSHLKRYCNTIKALCSYSKSKAERQSTQLEIE